MSLSIAGGGSVGGGSGGGTSYGPLSTIADANGYFGNLVSDASGHLFAISTYGDDGYGGVVELTPNGNLYTATTLASFDGAGGQDPRGGLVMDGNGNLFGVTRFGGAAGDGIVYEIVKTSTGYDATPVTVATFTGTNGANPYGTLSIDAAGNLYGTTRSGGTNGEGTVYEIVESGAGYSSAPTVLVSFSGSDSANPMGGLSVDAAGNLFGTTENGGRIMTEPSSKS